MRRYSIEDCQKTAKERGGKCLTTEYRNNQSNMWWECAYGHQWEASWGSIIYQKSWCSVCANNRKHSIELAHELARSNGGRCLSEVYINRSELMLWECKLKHQWEASYAGVKKGDWCSICAKNKKFGLEDVQKIAESRGGKCLSKEYINSGTDLLWECASGHQWPAKLVRINNKKKSWCPFCAKANKVKTNRRFTLEEVQALAEERNGKCLSKVYVNNHSKLEWACAFGHEWEATLMNVKNDKTWCPFCDKNIKSTLEEANHIALLNKGKCLSDAYLNKDELLLWECEKGHQWRASLGSVKNGGTWCRECYLQIRKHNYNLLKMPITQES